MSDHFQNIQRNSLRLYLLLFVLLSVLSAIACFFLLFQRQQHQVQRLADLQQSTMVYNTLSQQLMESSEGPLRLQLLYEMHGLEMYRLQSIMQLQEGKAILKAIQNTIPAKSENPEIAQHLTALHLALRHHHQLILQSLNEDGRVPELVEQVYMATEEADSAVQQSDSLEMAGEMAALSYEDIAIDKADQHLENMRFALARVHELLQARMTEARSEIAQSPGWHIALVWIVIFVILVVLQYVLVRKYIGHAVRKSGGMLRSIADGNLPAKVAVKNDDFSPIYVMGNELIDYLQDAGQFARKIGGGEFDHQFQPKSAQDSLGNALIEMRDRLQHVAKEDKVRNWTAEGQAVFADILREHSDDINALGEALVAKLADYLGASQAAIFVMNDTGERPHLDLLAAYAFNRKKHLSRRIEIGEGLVGQVFQEAKTAYITDVRFDHFNIVTGLGESRPSCIIIVPLLEDGVVEGVLELASFQQLEDHQIQFVERVATSIASSLRVGKINLQTRILLQETQEKAEEMKAQEEELRQNMEEISATQEQMERLRQEEEKMKREMHRQVTELRTQLSEKEEACKNAEQALQEEIKALRSTNK